MEDLIELITEHRNLPPFESIKFHVGGNVLLRQGDSFKVEVSAENESMIDKVITKVRRKKLKIYMGGWRSIFPYPKGEMEIVVQTPDVKRIEVSGMGKITSDGIFTLNEIKLVSSGVGRMELDLDAQYVKVNLSGTGDIRLSGKAEMLEVNMSGIGNVDAGAMLAQEAKIKSSGIGNANLQVDKFLKIRASSIGNIRYKGEAKVDSRFSGLGKVERL